MGKFGTIIKNLQTTGRPFTSRDDLDKKRKTYVDSLDPKSRKAYSSTYNKLETKSAKEQAKKDYAKLNLPSLTERAGAFISKVRSNQGQNRGVLSRLQESGTRQVGAFSPMQQTGGDRARSALFGSSMGEGGNRVRSTMYGKKEQSKDEFSQSDRVRKQWGL